MKDKTLLKTLVVSLLLIGASTLMYPYFAERSSRQAATWHLINTNVGGLYGEANLILTGDQVVMIDAGQRKAAETSVLKYLQRSSITRVNHLFISEANRTHFAGMATLIAAGIPIERIYYLKGFEQSFSESRKLRRFNKYLSHAKEHGSLVIPVEPGFRLALPGDAALTVLDVIPPAAERQAMPFQVSTMLMRFEVAGARVLFSGDIGRAYSDYLVEQARLDPAIKQKLATDYFKLPQPDTMDPTPAAFYDLVDASYAFVASPKRRWCTGEGAVAREWTFKTEIPTWVTGPNGSMRVIWQPDQAMILPQYINGKCKLREFGSLMVR